MARRMWLEENLEGKEWNLQFECEFCSTTETEKRDRLRSAVMRHKDRLIE